jgi:dTDP-glucose 4,6-dehydratase
VREWIYVDEHAKAVEFILAKGKAGESYNIGSGERASNLQLAKSLLKLLGKGESAIAFVADRPGHDYRYALDSSKLAKLGWKARIGLEDGLAKTVAWYKGNPRWVSSALAKN